MKHEGLRTWIEIDTKALKHNYNLFRGIISKKCKFMAVAKSNAYGHSIIDYARFMQKLGADWIAVDSVVEALTLQKAGIQKPMLILGYTLPERYVDVLRTHARPTLSSFEALRVAIKKSSQRCPLVFHLKVDTGMSRQGFFLEDLPRACEIIDHNRKKIIFEGIYTHFAAAKNPAFPADTTLQLERFTQAIAIAEGFGFQPLRHAAATSGTLLFPETHLDMVRIGIGMYGLWPAREVRAACEDFVELKPALSWKTSVGEIKTLKKGDRVGYDFTERMRATTTIAICPVGYWHGYPRALSSIGHALVRDTRARVCGRVSMDMIALDISGIKNVRVGEVVTILGGAVPADELADLAGISNYEMVTRINPLIQRIYL